MEKAETFRGKIQVNHYDAEGLRHEIEENGKLVSFIFSDREVVAETEKESTIRYIRGYDILCSDSECARTYYHYVCDEGGSTSHVLDETGKVLNQYEYDAFGNLIKAQEEVNNRFLYVGQQYDGVIMQYYLRARYYNPVVARFTQEDTYRGDGLNLYAYCQNNPVGYYDPSGYDSCGDSKKGNSKNGSDSVYIPRDAEGNPIPLNKQTVNGQDIPLPDPAAEGRPHTVLGGKRSSKTGEVYRQSATFPGGTWPTVNGHDVPWSEVHWTDHGTPHHHTNPHHHIFEYNPDKGGWIRRGPTKFEP